MKFAKEYIGNPRQQEQDKMTNNQSKMNTFEVAEVDEFMPIDIANGFISVIEKKNMPDELKLWAIDNIKNFNTLGYGQRKMLYDSILTKLVEDDE